MKKIRIGVMGAYRGNSMISYCKIAENAEVVAICDKWPDALEVQKELNKGMNITYYDNFDDFIQHDMDAVVLANYANEHAPFAIRAMRAGKHVFSEVLPVQMMKEAVELVETVEETGMIYAYGENYCYMPAPYEMRRLYREGKLGEFEYGEGEYIHNCETIAPSITYGDKTHWRNNMFANFYCTHSLGPLIHITGLRPVSVVGLEAPVGERHLRTGSKSGAFGLEMVTLENGGIIKSIHGGLYRDSIWYSVYGSKGRCESLREDVNRDGVSQLYTYLDEYSGQYDPDIKPELITPQREGVSAKFGHGGSDFYTVLNFVKKINGDPDADTIDVYEALDMSLPGLFAYRSVLEGGVTMPIPNLRNKEDRDKWRNDTACTDPKVAGDHVWPSYSKGNPEIGDEVYQLMYDKWQEDMRSETGYTHLVYGQATKHDEKTEE